MVLTFMVDVLLMKVKTKLVLILIVMIDIGWSKHEQSQTAEEKGQQDDIQKQIR